MNKIFPLLLSWRLSALNSLQARVAAMLVWVLTLVMVVMQMQAYQQMEEGYQKDLEVHLEQVKDLNDKLQFLESEADNHMMTLYKELFSGKHDAVQVVVLKDLYELLEKVIDRCRDAGNVVMHIVLKNS